MALLDDPRGASALRPAAPTFRCVECGAASIRWVGRCPECQAWGTLSESGASATVRSVRPGPVSGPARPIGDHDPERARAQPTGIAELAIELMCARAEQRVAFGKPLAEQGVVRDWIAESRVRIEQLRLLVLKTAWLWTR